ncbi:MAG: hypothetical protein ABI068_04840 [Ktedonobacterales bacterium]
MGIALLLTACGPSGGSGAGTPTPNPKLSPMPLPFRVTSVDLAVSPDNIAGLVCGSHVTFTYTVTFHLLALTIAGVIQFNYTFNNGRGGNRAQITVAAGQTTATYSFKWSGNLPADHFYPEGGGVIVGNPNLINSPLLAPSDACS